MLTTICNTIFPPWKKKRIGSSNCVLGRLFLPFYGFISLLDYVQTYYGIYHLGREELSPVVNWLILNNYFIWSYPLISIAIVILSNIMLYWLYSKGELAGYRIFFFCMIIPKLHAVINNIYIIGKYW